MEFNSHLLEKLVKVYGPSSREERVAEFIKSEVEKYVDEVYIDALGNLIAHKKGNGKKIMISSHMDQIGLMVIDIDDNGFIRFTNVGGISPVISVGQKVIFSNGTVGLVFNEPNEDGKIKLEDLYIDIGVSSKKEALEFVNIGDICIYKSDFTETKDIVITPYLDDRIGCLIAIETIKTIKDNKNDLYFVFSVQEEVGLRGAKTSAYEIEPDIGISLDVTLTGDTPKAKRLAVKMGSGAAIKVKDGSMITSPKIKDILVNLAKENQIDYQLEILEFAGTDSGSIHLSKSGVPSGVISIPSRYVHSPVEMVSKNDVINCKKLLDKFIDFEF